MNEFFSLDKVPSKNSFLWSNIDVNKIFNCQNENFHPTFEQQSNTQIFLLDNITRNIDCFNTFDQSETKLLDGYFYNSPIHEGVLCWRSFAEQATDFNPFAGLLDGLNFDLLESNKNSSIGKVNQSKKNLEMETEDVNEVFLNYYDKDASEKMREILQGIHKDLLIQTEDGRSNNKGNANRVDQKKKIKDFATNRITSNLDDCSSDDIPENKNNSDLHEKKRYKKSNKTSQSLKLKNKPTKKSYQDIEKTDDELISDFEKLSRKSPSHPTIKHETIDNLNPKKDVPQVLAEKQLSESKPEISHQSTVGIREELKAEPKAQDQSNKAKNVVDNKKIQSNKEGNWFRKIRDRVKFRKNLKKA